MKKLALAALAAASLAALPAAAQQGWYGGFGIGRGNLNMSGQDLTGLSGASVNDSDTTYTVRGGYRFHPNLAVELGYYDLGQYEFNGSLGSSTVSGSAKAKSWGVSLVAIAPLGDAFDIYGRVGIAQSELKANANISISPQNANVSDKQTEATYGVGGRWWITKNLGVFAEWMKNDKIEVDSYLAGVDFRW